MNFCIAMLLFYYTRTLIRGQEITSTGQHASDEFLWAVDVNDLSFNISFTGITNGNYYKYLHDWSHVLSDGEATVSATVSFRVSFVVATDGSITGVICYYGNKSSNPQQIVSPDGIEYRIDCALVDSTLTSRFTIISSLNSSYNGSEVKVKMVPPGTGVYTKHLKLKFCADLEKNERLEISDGTNAKCGDIANYTCVDSALVINDTYNKNVNTYSRTCNYDAMWSGQGVEIACWFAPDVNVSIEQNGLISSGILISENDCFINCSILAKGNPTKADTIYYKNGGKLSEDTFSVVPDDDGGNVSCQMRNSYVNEVDGSAGFSQLIILEVLYQPESTSGNSNDEQLAQVGQNYNITVMFNANPCLEVSNTTMYLEGEKLNSSNAKIDHEGSLHIYKYPLIPVTNRSFGIYTLSTKSPAPQLAKRITNFTVILSMVLTSTISIPYSNKVTSSSFTTATTDDSAVDEDGLKAGIIAAIAVGGILIIILLVVGGIYIKRKRSPKSNSNTLEERDNPLYGTTATSRLDEEYATVNKQNKKNEKEEKVNPLYQSTRETDRAAIEPAYGSVGQEGDSNEAGPSSAVNPSTSEVTYAAVNKPKKNKKSADIESATNQDTAEVTYAAVNKPKKRDKAEANDSTVDPNHSEVTYAAVNKPKKNK